MTIGNKIAIGYIVICEHAFSILVAFTTFDFVREGRWAMAACGVALSLGILASKYKVMKSEMEASESTFV